MVSPGVGLGCISRDAIAGVRMASPGVGLGRISRDAIAGVRMASASTPLPGASVKVHYKEQRSLAHQDRKGFSIGYRSFAAMLAGLREQTLG